MNFGQYYRRVRMEVGTYQCVGCAYVCSTKAQIYRHLRLCEKSTFKKVQE
jgi:hypothetical protein